MTGRETSFDSMQRMVGLEYLRVFFMVSVVAFHAGVVTEWAVRWQGDANVRANVFDVLSYNLQSVAVPCFFIISNFLFCLKPINRERLTARLIRLFSLYLFWVSLMVYHYRPEVNFSPAGIIRFFVSGGETFYYFLAVLILLSPVTFLVQKLHGAAMLCCGVISALALLATMIWLQQNYYFAQNMNHCIVTSYALVPMCAVLLARHRDKIQSSARLAKYVGFSLVGAGIVASLIEWQFAAPGEYLDSYRMWLPKHARFSLYLFASALVIFAMRVSSKPGRFMSFMSKNALGIYCLHGFCIGEIVVLSRKVMAHWMPAAASAVGCILTVACCAAAAEFLRRALKRRLI